MFEECFAPILGRLLYTYFHTPLGAHEVAGEHGNSIVAIHDETDGMILL
jgi:hypothetical protein